MSSSIQKRDKPKPRQRAGEKRPAASKYLAALLLGGLLAFLLGVGGSFLIERWHGSQPKNSICSSGRIEFEQSRLAALMDGRVAAVDVHEGQHVRKGQLLVEMDDALVQAPLKEARQELALAEHALSSASRHAGALSRSMKGGSSGSAGLKSQAAAGLRLKAENQGKNSPGGNAEAPPGDQPAGKGAAETTDAELSGKAGEQAVEKKSPGAKAWHVVTAPFRLLLKPLSVLNPAHEVKKEIASAQLKQKKVMKEQISIMQSRAESQAKVLQKQMEAAEQKAALMQAAMKKGVLSGASAQVLMAREQLTRAQAACAMLEQKLKECKVTSPMDGICTLCVVQPGDVVSRGHTLLIVADPSQAYMRTYVPEGDIAAVKFGQAARVKLDSGKGIRTLSAHVSSIDEKPSFTPENVYLKNDRIRQVFGVKLALDHPDGSAKPGMPCDSEIFRKETGE